MTAWQPRGTAVVQNSNSILSHEWTLSGNPSPKFLFSFRIWVSHFSSMKTPARSSCSCYWPNMSKLSVNSPPQHTGRQLHCNYTHQISPKSSKFKLPESTCWTCWTYWTHIGCSSLVKPDVLSGWYNNESFLYAFAAQSDVWTAQRSPDTWPRLSHHLATQLGRPSWFPRGAHTRQHPKPANFQFWEQKFRQNRCAMYIYIYKWI